MSDAIKVRRLAELAKLSLTDAEAVRLEQEMSRVIAFAQQLAQVDLTDIPPMANVLDEPQQLRADEVQSSLEAQTVLQSAPATQGACIVVPRTVEG